MVFQNFAVPVKEFPQKEHERIVKLQIYLLEKTHHSTILGRKNRSTPESQAEKTAALQNPRQKKPHHSRILDRKNRITPES